MLNFVLFGHFLLFSEPLKAEKPPKFGHIMVNFWDGKCLTAQFTHFPCAFFLRFTVLTHHQR